MRGQRCYRGDQCPFEHPQPGNMSSLLYLTLIVSQNVVIEVGFF